MRKSVIVFAMLLAGCAAKEQKQTMEEMQQPVNCATAEGDIRALESEKAHVQQQIAAGVTAIAPVGLVMGAATKTEGTKMKVASGEYNDMIDRRIAEIKQTCGL